MSNHAKLVGLGPIAVVRPANIIEGEIRIYPPEGVTELVLRGPIYVARLDGAGGCEPIGEPFDDAVATSTVPIVLPFQLDSPARSLDVFARSVDPPRMILLAVVAPRSSPCAPSPRRAS